MKRIYQVVLLLVIAVISFKCQKELSGDIITVPTGPNNPSSPITATLQGNILDENGKPAAGVTISAASKTTTTNTRGYFRIADASLDKNSSVVIAEYPGYFKAYRSFRATSGVNQLVIKLTKKTLAGTVDGIAGGEVKLTNGAKVSLAAGGIIKATGAAYAGSVQVYAAYIDPTSKDIGKIVPGSFMADDKDNKRVVLSSYGMLAVDLESSTGEKLQVATGSTAVLTIPIPPSIASSAPSTISLWYVDEQTGIWKEQGMAKKSGNNYVGEVKHFSSWNCDIGLPAIGFSALLKTADNLPVKNVSVGIRMADSVNGGLAHGYTDSLGQLSGLVPVNQNLVLEVFDNCYNVVYAKNIGPFQQITDLGTIVVPSTVSSFVTVKGKLLSCNNTPVAHGYAIVSWDNLVSYVTADAEGNFSTNILTCSGIPLTCEILGVDAAVEQEGSYLTIPVTSPVTDAGNIISCGVSSSEFINYTLDGSDYTLSSLDRDSLFAFSFALSGSTTIFNTSVQGSDSQNKLIGFNFNGNTAAGVYPLNSLNVRDYNRIGLDKPFNVTITSFPQTWIEFYEGSFSGNFIDSSASSVTHNIKCTFRLRGY